LFFPDPSFLFLSNQSLFSDPALSIPNLPSFLSPKSPDFSNNTEEFSFLPSGEIKIKKLLSFPAYMISGKASFFSYQIFSYIALCFCPAIIAPTAFFRFTHNVQTIS